MPYRLGLVIPALDEGRRLPTTLSAIAADLGQLPEIELRAIVVADNGSKDETARVAREAGATLGLPLCVLMVPRRGKGAAVRAGVLLLAEQPALDGILFMDADNATALNQLARFDLSISALQIGSRLSPGAVIVPLGGRARSPLTRRVLSAGMRLLARVVLGIRIADTQCGFKLVPAAAAAELYGALRETGWAFDVELLALARRQGLAIRTAPVYWIEQAESKVHPVRDAVGSILAVARIRLRLWFRNS